MSDHQSNQSYSQGLSELMVETIQPEQPSPAEVAEYAVEVLGMRLPEDQPLLYLAQAAMKSNVPEDWQVYQRSNGDIYYRNKVTLQKTQTHPADVHYLSMYKQEKRKLMFQDQFSRRLQPIYQDQELSQSPSFTNKAKLTQSSSVTLDQYQIQLRNNLTQVRQELENTFDTAVKIEQDRHKHVMYSLNRKQTSPVEIGLALKQGQVQSEMREEMESKYEVISRQMWKELYHNMQVQDLADRTNLERQFQLWRREVESRLDAHRKQLQEEGIRAKHIKDTYSTRLRQQLRLVTKRADQREIQTRIQTVNQALSADTQVRINKVLATYQKQYKGVVDSLVNRDQNYKCDIVLQKGRLQTMSQQKVEAIRRKQQLKVQAHFSSVLRQQKQKVKVARQSIFKAQEQVTRNQLTESSNKQIQSFKDRRQMSVIEGQHPQSEHQRSCYRKLDVSHPAVSVNEENNKLVASQLRERFQKVGQQLKNTTTSIRNFEEIIACINFQKRILGPCPEEIQSLLIDHNPHQVSQASSPKTQSLDQHQQTRTIRTRLEEDKRFLLKAREFLDSKSTSSFKDRLRVKRSNNSQADKARKARAIGQSISEMKKLYQRDLQTIISNSEAIGRYQNYIGERPTSEAHQLPPYIELELRAKILDTRGTDRQKLAFFGTARTKQNSQITFVNQIRRFKHQSQTIINNMGRRLPT